MSTLSILATLKDLSAIFVLWMKLSTTLKIQSTNYHQLSSIRFELFSLAITTKCKQNPTNHNTFQFTHSYKLWTHLHTLHFRFFSHQKRIGLANRAAPKKALSSRTSRDSHAFHDQSCALTIDFPKIENYDTRANGEEMWDFWTFRAKTKDLGRPDCGRMRGRGSRNRWLVQL